MTTRLSGWVRIYSQRRPLLSSLPGFVREEWVEKTRVPRKMQGQTGFAIGVEDQALFRAAEDLEYAKSSGSIAFKRSDLRIQGQGHASAEGWQFGIPALNKRCRSVAGLKISTMVDHCQEYALKNKRPRIYRIPNEHGRRRCHTRRGLITLSRSMYRSFQMLHYNDADSKPSKGYIVGMEMSSGPVSSTQSASPSSRRRIRIITPRRVSGAGPWPALHHGGAGIGGRAVRLAHGRIEALLESVRRKAGRGRELRGCLTSGQRVYR
jgi:hypothetical protein